ncbi:hypothetical protein ACFVH6_17050 [Spirillospora sp. NPDC127200]
MHTLLRRRVRAALLLVGGLSLVAVGITMLAVMVPGGDDELRAYQAAQRCATVPSVPRDCLWTEEFTVSSVHLTNARGKASSVRLRDQGGDEWTVKAEKGALVGLDKGERVTGTIWRGTVTELSADGDTQKTRDTPANMRTRAFIGALILLPPGLLAMVAGAWRLIRSRRPELTPGMSATTGLAFTLVFTGLFSPVFAAGEEEDFSNTLIAWLIMAAIAAVVAVGYAAHLRSEKAESTETS